MPFCYVHTRGTTTPTELKYSVLSFKAHLAQWLCRPAAIATKLNSYQILCPIFLQYLVSWLQNKISPLSRVSCRFSTTRDGWDPTVAHHLSTRISPVRRSRYALCLSTNANHSAHWHLIWNAATYKSLLIRAGWWALESISCQGLYTFLSGLAEHELCGGSAAHRCQMGQTSSLSQEFLYAGRNLFEQFKNHEIKISTIILVQRAARKTFRVTACGPISNFPVWFATLTAILGCPMRPRYLFITIHTCPGTLVENRH